MLASRRAISGEFLIPFRMLHKLAGAVGMWITAFFDLRGEYLPVFLSVLDYVYVPEMT